jgi:hypothetical protein
MSCQGARPQGGLRLRSEATRNSRLLAAFPNASPGPTAEIGPQWSVSTLLKVCSISSMLSPTPCRSWSGLATSTSQFWSHQSLLIFQSRISRMDGMIQQRRFSEPFVAPRALCQTGQGRGTKKITSINTSTSIPRWVCVTSEAPAMRGVLVPTTLHHPCKVLHAWLLCLKLWVFRCTVPLVSGPSCITLPDASPPNMQRHPELEVPSHAHPAIDVLPLKTGDSLANKSEKQKPISRVSR